MIPEEAELINVTKYNKIWLRLNNNLYEYDLLTARTAMALTNIYEVIIKMILMINNYKVKLSNILISCK